MSSRFVNGFANVATNLFELEPEGSVRILYLDPWRGLLPICRGFVKALAMRLRIHLESEGLGSVKIGEVCRDINCDLTPPLIPVNIETLCHQHSTMLDRSFLPTSGRQPQQKLEQYAQLYVAYSTMIQRQGDAMRNNPEAMQRAYAQVAAEFAMEQYSANNKMGASFILSDLNEYARRCDKIPNSFEE